MSVKNSNDTIGNRIRDLPACSAVPQPTAPPLAPVCIGGTTDSFNVLVEKPEGSCNFKNIVGECRLDSGNSGYGSELAYTG